MTRWLRWSVSLGLLGLIIFHHGDTLDGILAETQLRWIALALLISIAQVLLSAWRWRYTALRLETALGLRTAIGEYYLAMLVNQLLPGGVLGDAQRAWRQRCLCCHTLWRGLPAREPAWHLGHIQTIEQIRPHGENLHTRP